MCKSTLDEGKKMTDFDKQEFYTKWVAALRSGDYEQAQGTLSVNYESFCCLGVACEVAGVRRKSTYGGDGYENIFNDDSEVINSATNAQLPKQLAKALGWKWETGAFDIGTYRYREPLEYELSVLNDDGFTFDQIADIIEYFFMNEGSNA